MFDALSERLDAALQRVKGRGRLDEKTVDATLKEIRLALLEADVNFKVVRGFVERLREVLVGEEVSKALNPSQHVVKAVHDEIVTAHGGQSVPMDLGNAKPAVIMLAGLQGSGKTTAAGKLATATQADCTLLVRLEVNPAAGMCRVSVRSPSEALYAAVAKSVASQLGTPA